MSDTSVRLRVHTHELVRVDAFERKTTIPDLLGASYEMWIESSESKREKAVRALEARGRRYEILIDKH